MLKKIIASIALTLIMMIMSACNNVSSMTAQEIAKEMGVGINLGNTMESTSASNYSFWVPIVGSNRPSDYETCWGAVETTQEIIDGMKAEGFDTVRIPVYWGNMMADRKSVV